MGAVSCITEKAASTLNQSQQTPQNRFQESGPSHSHESLPDQSQESPPDQSQESPPDQSHVSPPDQSQESPPDQSQESPPDQSQESLPVQSQESPPVQSQESPPDQSQVSPPDQSQVSPPDQSQKSPPDQSQESPSSQSQEHISSHELECKGFWYYKEQSHDLPPEGEKKAFVPPYGKCVFSSDNYDVETVEAIGSKHNIQMYMHDTAVPPLKLAAHQPKALKVSNITNSSQLKSLPSFMSLESLNLFDNDFSMGLPEVIGEVSSLEKLDLRECNLTKLPLSMAALTKLKNLNLSNALQSKPLHPNNFSKGLSESIGKLASLEELNLRGCNLSDLPKSLILLKNLKRLNLNDNIFSNGLPEVIGLLPALEELNLEHCGLSNLPNSLSSLKNLRILNLSHNNFCKGLPEIVGKLPSLQQLNLGFCELTKLPKSFGMLKALKLLCLDSNNFESLPSAICKLANIRKLTLSNSGRLEALHSELVCLTRLEELDISECNSLFTPPPNVTIQGLSAIQQYYKDMADGEGRSLPAATVSIIGKSRSGKTSLIRTLQSNSRVLTDNLQAGKDVSTKVFNFEEVEVNNTKLRFIDFGGQEVYQIAYGLTLRENCVPVVVVNIEMYHDLANEIGDREAVRELYFDWMAHLYLTQPDLPAPRLVITHKDRFSPEAFDKILCQFLNKSNDVRDAILSEERRCNQRHFHEISHLSDKESLFPPENIFKVGSEYENHIFDRLKAQLLKLCSHHVMKLPSIWEDIEESVLSSHSEFSLFDEMFEHLESLYEVDREQLEVIVTYMHNCGKILWYKNEKSLDRYVFHKISTVVKLLNVLYDHDDASKWKRRHDQFQECQLQSKYFHLEKYEQDVQQFEDEGIMSWMLLAYLIHSETDFKTDEEQVVSLALLTSFRLAFGLVQSDHEPMYVLPYFVPGYLPSVPSSTTDIQLHVDLLFKGLPLPLYVYHEMTVGLLKQFPSRLDTPTVRGNGAVVETHDLAVRLTHDAKAKKVTVLISSKPKDLAVSWHHLITVVKATTDHVLKTWKAARFECIFYCAHCKLTDSTHPEKIVGPSWCSLTNYSEDAEGTALRMVICKKTKEKVYSALRFPCKSLSQDEKKELQKYVDTVKSKIIAPRLSQPPVAYVPVPPLPIDTGYGKHSTGDVAKMLEDMKCLPTLTHDKAVKDLYHNTNQVYKMTSPRGLALIINNRIFPNRRDPERLGSEVDVRNMKEMLNHFDFQVQLKEDLPGKDMLPAIASTLKECPDQLDDMGMFVLVLMSHGGENDKIYGTDDTAIDLNQVYVRLSARYVPALAGKPKLVAVQACGGEMKDFGEQGDAPNIQTDSGPVVTAALSSQSAIQNLDTDDLIVIKASFNQYSSIRHGLHGSPFISCLVHHFCKYACDKDVRTICDMIQEDVREQSKELYKKFPKYCFGQAPFTFNMLTKRRKLYLFPGYNGD